ncbi:hypothetical protein ABZ215_24630 [Amycolatopsis sp. NPDC006131]|uniref:hypothetical protein n=1 Tax=Amycolatopsis sp. NPDC006131 TaxID=3156731 RepID=UPI0033A2F198
MSDQPDLFSCVIEPEPPVGALSRVRHFGDLARQGRLDALTAIGRIEAEVDAFLARAAAARDAEVLGDTEGRLRVDAKSTSERAARLVQPKTGNQRGKILIDIVEHGGSTDYELEHRLGLLASSVRPRRVELVQSGFIIDSGRVRHHQGSQWTLWVATEAGHAWYSANIGRAA